MGYKVQRRTTRLTFEEHPGLEVVVSTPSAGSYMSVVELASLSDGPEFTSEDMAKIAKLFDHFANVLVSWNLEDEAGNAIPATLGGIQCSDLFLMLQIVLGWIGVVLQTAPTNSTTTVEDIPSTLNVVTNRPE